MLKVTTIGGGGGHAQVLKSLKHIKGVEITGICPSTDSGGSTGILKENYDARGYLGDLTKCVAALCPDDTFGKALMYRYGKGPLSGHSVKNLLLLSLEKVAGTEGGLADFWKVCGLKDHRILPVTVERTELCATLKMGDRVVSETNIDLLAKNPLWNPNTHAIRDIYLKPEVSASRDAKRAVKDSDWIIICPGDLYSSVIPVLLPKGMKEAVQRSKASVVIVLNIMNKKGETDHYTAEHFVALIERYIGRKVDVVLCNDSKIPKKALAKYALEEKIIFKPGSKRDARVRYAPFAAIRKKGNLIHDPEVMKEVFISLFSKI